MSHHVLDLDTLASTKQLKPIAYRYYEFNVERNGSWTGTEAEALAEAVQELDAVRKDAETYSYMHWGENERERVTVSRERLISFGAALCDGCTRDEVYDLWFISF